MSVFMGNPKSLKKNREYVDGRGYPPLCSSPNKIDFRAGFN